MPDPGFCIRPATAGDLDAMIVLEAEPEAARFLGVLGRPFHDRALADPDQEQLVAEIGGALAGFVVLAGLLHGDGRIELRRIVVARTHRGAGWGRRLFRTAVARAYQRHDARQVWLDVKPGNARALMLYTSEGFVPCGTIPDPTEPGGTLKLLVHTP